MIGRSSVEKPPILSWIALAIVVATLAAFCWWRWNRDWRAIESGHGGKVTAEQPQAEVPAEVMEKLVTHRVDPEYPAAARPAKLEGIVVLDIVVGSDGSVIGMQPVSGPEVLANAAMDALRWWRFVPYRIDGKAVAIETKVAVEFHP